MRFNTPTKRKVAAEYIQNFLEDVNGYGKETAKYEVNLWVNGGSSILSPTVYDHIRIAKLHYIKRSKNHAN